MVTVKQLVELGAVAPGHARRIGDLAVGDPQHADEVVAGTGILQLASGASRCVIAIGADKADAIQALRKALQGQAIELRLLPPNYPLGSEPQLVEALTGKQIPAGASALALGLLLTDVATAKGIHDAIVLGQPRISRVTTVCGDAVQTPKNFRVRLGTPLGFLLELCGVDYQRIDRLIVGGSLTGFTIDELDTPETARQTASSVSAGLPM